MIEVVLMLMVGETLLEREIQMPFAPVPEMDLMLGESAWWNQMQFTSVMWFDECKYIQCNMRLHYTGKLSEDEIIQVMTNNLWSIC